MQGAALPGAPEGEAFRFVAIGDTGRTATVYEARRTGGRAERTQITLIRAPDGAADAPGGWRVVTRDTRYLAGESYDYYVRLIDAAAKAPPAPATTCAASPVYFADHAGRTVGGGCPEDDAAGRIARALGLVDDDRGPVLLK